MATRNQECSICGSMSQVQVRAHKSQTTLSTEFSVESYGPNQRLFPCELDLIHLVYLEYALEFGDVCLHSCVQRKKELEPIVEYLAGALWKLLEIKDISQGDPRQHSAAFYNTASHQLVIVHRGTEFIENPESTKADFHEIVKQNNGPFSAAAYLFTKKIVDSYGNGAESITVTGHSLGGWLSQCATFYMKYPQYLERLKTKIRKKCHGNPICDKLELIKAKDCKARHLHCVSFDGPGCKEVLEKLFPKYLDDRSLTFQKLDSLDITVYLTSQNFVNISNQQVGSVFRMDCESIFSPTLGQVQEAGILKNFWHRFSKKEWREQFLESHSSEKILEFWNAYDEQSRITGAFFSDQSQVARVMKVTNWAAAERMWLGIPIASEDDLIEIEEMNPFEFRMSCFDDNVRQSIRQLMTCKKHYSDHSVWQDYCKRPSIEFLTTRFECLFDFQVVKLGWPELQNLSEYGKGLYRDCFIRNIRIANQEFKRLGIDAIFPNYLEAMYISNTDQYVKSLPTFVNDETESELEAFIQKNFANLNNSRFVISIRTPTHGTRICTAKIYNVLKSLSQDGHGSDAKYLQDRKQFFVLSTTFLSKLSETLGNSSDLILPNLKHVVIECETEPQLELVKDWIDKLWSRGGIETKIVIVHGFGVETRVTRHATAVAVHNLEVDQNHIQQLCANVNPISLMRNQRISFKREGAHIYFRDLVSEDEHPHFYNELASLGGLAIYSTFQRGCLGELLPKLDEFDESCFLERTFQEIEVEGYEASSGGGMESIYVVCDSQGQAIADNFRKGVPEENCQIILCSNWAEIDCAGKKGHVLEVQDYKWHSKKGKEKRGQKLVWRKTFGNPDMTRLKLTGFGTQDWRVLLRNSPGGKPNQVKIIADEPGMGKTTIMQKLALRSQKDKGAWTIFLELGKVASKLDKTEMKIDKVIEALARVEADKDWQIVAIFLGHLLQEEGRVRIFLDGFDEIKESLQQVVLEIVEFLARETKARIFLASRDRLLRELTEKLKIPCYKLNPLRKEQSSEFLEHYWTRHKDFRLEFGGKVMKNQQNLRNFVVRFFRKFQESIGTEADKFVGIPFQLGMLAEGSMRNSFFDFFREFCDSEAELEFDQFERHVPTFTNITDLYKLFIKTKIETGLQRKHGLLPATEDFEESVEKMLKLHKYAGFAKIFNAKLGAEISIGASTRIETEPSAGEKAKLHGCGIVKKYCSRSKEESYESDESEFVHRTVAEFLAAEFILQNLKRNFKEQSEQMTHFLNSYIFLRKYENVLHFLNKLIVTDHETPQVLKDIADPGTVNVVRLALEQFSAQNTEVDCFGRNVLHYLVIFYLSERPNDCDLCRGRNTNIFLMEAHYLFDVKDLFEATPLAYIYSTDVGHWAISRSSAVCLSSILFNTSLQPKSGMPESTAALGGDIHDKLDKYWSYSLRTAGICVPPCKAALDPHPSIITIIEFVEENAKYLSDCRIPLLRNELDLESLSGFPIFENFDLETALALGGESRINFIRKLGRHFDQCENYGIPNECKIRKGFAQQFFDLLRADNFRIYEKVINCLTVESETYLLSLFINKTKHFKSMQNAVYNVWANTNFSSLLRALKSDRTGQRFFEMSYKLLPRKSHNSEAKFVLDIEDCLNQFPMANYKGADCCTRNARFVCIFPIVFRLLEKNACRDFVHKHIEVINYALRTDPVPLNYREDLEIVQTFLNCLYETESGPQILDKFQDIEVISRYMKQRRQ